MADIPPLPQGPVRLDPFSRGSREFLVVVDTDALLSSIENHCRTGSPSRISRMAAAYRDVPIFAADHVFGEVYDGFAKMESATGTAAQEMRRLFEKHYLPGIRWVDVADLPVWDRRVAQVTDHTDVPSAKLATLICPCLVLSQDKSLRRPGFAPSEWRPAAGHALAVVESRESIEGMAMVVALPLYGGFAGTVKLGNRVGLPWYASVGLLVVGLGYLFADTSRRSAFGSRIGPLVTAMLEHMAEEQHKAAEGSHGLTKAMCRPASESSARQMVAMVLARESEPRLAQEIHDRMLELFDKHVQVSVTEVRGILRSGREFVQPERSRWQLGRRSVPWAG